MAEEGYKGSSAQEDGLALQGQGFRNQNDVGHSCSSSVGSLSVLKERQSCCTCGDHLCSAASPSRSLSSPKGPEFLEVRDM